MFAILFPENEDRNATNPNDKRCNNLGLVPLRFYSASKSKRNKDKCENGNQKDNADDIQLPEEGYCKLASTQKLIWAFILQKSAIILCSSVDEE